MQFSIAILSFLFLSSLTDYGQSNREATALMILNTDSVLLISHITTQEHHDKREGKLLVFDSLGKVINNIDMVDFPSFLVGHDVNTAIVIQRKLLFKHDVEALANIIRIPVKRTGIGYSPSCFEPHHAILMYKMGRLSYIDLCFHCKGLVTSTNIVLMNSDFLNGKWSKMEAFFIKQGLTYEMADKN